MSKEQDPLWKIKEKIVTILERHLSHGAKIERDQNLKVITSKSGRTRQCDVVITEGTKARPTISIVEVQQRDSKPSIGDFSNWLIKMEEVGAQHLICVSEKGFPASIIEKAEERGPSVRLLTLKELEHSDTPFQLGFFSDELQVVRYDKLVGLEMAYEHLIKKEPCQSNQLPNPFEKIFRVNGDELLSVTDIMDWHLFNNPKNLQELPINKDIPLLVKIDFPATELFEYEICTDQWMKLRSLKINFRLIIRNKKLNWNLERYEQVGHGEMGWIAKATSDDKKYNIMTPIKYVSEGQYSFGRPVTMNDNDAFVALGDKGFKAEYYSD